MGRFDQNSTDKKLKRTQFFGIFSAKTQYFSETQPICYKFYFIKKSQNFCKELAENAKNSILTNNVQSESQKTLKKSLGFSTYTSGARAIAGIE